MACGTYIHARDLRTIIIIIQKYDMTGLSWAAYGGHEQVMDMLLKAGATPDFQDHVIN